MNYLIQHFIILNPPSKFDFTEKFSGLVFENIKDSIIVVGHGNIIQNRFQEVYGA